MTTNEAKTIPPAGGLDIANHVPDEFVTSIEQSPQGSLLSCEGTRNYRWAGHTRIILTPDTDRDVLTEQIMDATKRADGWGVAQKTSASGEPRLTMSSPDCVTFVADGWSADPLRYEVSSLSPCCHLPDGQSPRGKF